MVRYRVRIADTEFETDTNDDEAADALIITHVTAAPEEKPIQRDMSCTIREIAVHLNPDQYLILAYLAHDLGQHELPGR